MRFFIGDFGPVPMALVDEEGKIIFLGGTLVKWIFKNRDGSKPPGTPITAIITSTSLGEVEFDLPSSLTTTKTKYNTVIVIENIPSLTRTSVSRILVDIDAVEGV